MREKIYLYSPTSLFEIVKDMLFDYNITPLATDDISNNNFKNNNILFVLRDDKGSEINKLFLSNNNVLIFFSERQKLSNSTKFNNVGFFYGHSSVKKFVDEIKTSFIFKTIILKNIEILGEKITNKKSGKSFLLTELEKKILIVLLENKKVTRDYILEEVLKIKKNIETKTIESHLTRIRRKLLSIKSEIQIKSKENIFYLEA